MVETSNYSSELMLTNVSATPKALALRFVADGIPTPDHSVTTQAPLAAGQQLVIPEAMKEVRIQGMGSPSGDLVGPLFVTEADGDLGGIVVAARTVTPALVAGGQYGVSYNAVPYGSAFSRVAWVEGLQQNGESRSNLALVNTGEVDDSESVFNIEVYDGDTGLLVSTLTGRTVPARGWHQIDSILRNYARDTSQGYVRIEIDLGQQPLPGLRGDQRRRQPRGTQRRRRLYPGKGVGWRCGPMAGRERVVREGRQKRRREEKSYPRRHTKDYEVTLRGWRSLNRDPPKTGKARVQRGRC